MPAPSTLLALLVVALIGASGQTNEASPSPSPPTCCPASEGQCLGAETSRQGWITADAPGCNSTDTAVALREKYGCIQDPNCTSTWICSYYIPPTDLTSLGAAPCPQSNASNPYP